MHRTGGITDGLSLLAEVAEADAAANMEAAAQQPGHGALPELTHLIAETVHDMLFAPGMPPAPLDQGSFPGSPHAAACPSCYMVMPVPSLWASSLS